MCHSRATGFTVDPSLRILFSRLTVQGRLQGARDVKAGGTPMMIHLIVMIGVECPLLPREVGLTPIGSKMTDASSVLGGELHSTPESQA